MRFTTPIKLSDEEYWALKKKMAEAECLTWREFLLKVSGVLVEEVVEHPPIPAVPPSLEISAQHSEKQNVAKAIASLKITKGKRLVVKKGKKVVITK